MRRVVVTGLGLVTPLASGVEATWSRLLNGVSGAATISRFDASGLATNYACEVPYGDGSDGTFNPDDWMSAKERRKVDDFILYGIAAAQQAVVDSGWLPEDEEAQERTGVMIGSGIGGLQSIAETTLLLRDRGPRRVSPFFILLTSLDFVLVSTNEASMAINEILFKTSSPSSKFFALSWYS